MAKRRITPLAQALVLVDSLSQDEQVTLVDYIKGKLPQATRRPKSKPAPSAGARSRRGKTMNTSAANTEVETASATAVGASGAGD